MRKNKRYSAKELEYYIHLYLNDEKFNYYVRKYKANGPTALISKGFIIDIRVILKKKLFRNI